MSTWPDKFCRSLRPASISNNLLRKIGLKKQDVCSFAFFLSFSSAFILLLEKLAHLLIIHVSLGKVWSSLVAILPLSLYANYIVRKFDGLVRITEKPSPDYVQTFLLTRHYIVFCKVYREYRYTT